MTLGIQFSSRYQKSTSVVAREIAGEWILVPIRHNVGDLDSIYTLNDTAARAWQLLDGQRTLDEISQVVVAEYAVEQQQALADILELFAQLEEIGAVTRL